MTDPLHALIEALRQELQQYGEMLARLDLQQESIMRRAADDVLVSVTAIQEQGAVIQQARHLREDRQRELAGHFRQPAKATLAQLTERIPADYQPLVRALVDENNQLLVRVQQRARQNHLLLSRSLELMRNLLRTLLPTGQGAVYDDSGNSLGRSLPDRALYDAAG
jgi:uncharacterized membrane-anchored protein YhcB (DUF1043 family)